MANILSQRRRRRGMLIPLVTLLCFLSLLLPMHQAEAKTSSSPVPQSYYVNSFGETVDGQKYTLEERSYPTYSGSPNSSYLTLPQIDAWQNGQYKWSIMGGQLHEWIYNGHRYSRVDLTTSGDAPGNIHQQVQWYPDESQYGGPFTFSPDTNCGLTSSIHEAQWGTADASFVCNQNTPYTFYGDDMYDPLNGTWDEIQANAPAAQTFNTAAYEQWRHLQNILDYGESSQVIAAHSILHPQAVSALAVGCAFLAAGLLLVIAGHVMQNTLNNYKWAKIVGGVMADIGSGVFLTGGGLIVGPIVAGYVMGEGAAATGAVELAEVASQASSETASYFSAEDAAIRNSLEMQPE